MILKNYINISIKNIVRNKKNTLKIFSITLFSFILFILTTSLSGSLNDFIKNYILNTIEHRTIMIDYSSVQNINIENKINNLLKNDSSIVEFYEYEPPIAGDIKNSKELFNNNNNNAISLISGFEQKMPDIINCFCILSLISALTNNGTKRGQSSSPSVSYINCASFFHNLFISVIVLIKIVAFVLLHCLR